MPIATPEVYNEMLDRAKKEQFAFPAINCTLPRPSTLHYRGLQRPSPTASSSFLSVVRNSVPARQ